LSASSTNTAASFPRTAFGWKLRALWGGLKLDSWGVRMGKLISFVIIIAFSIGATLFFRSVFRSMLELEGIGEPLLWRVIGITLTTVFAMLIVSNLITGIATLYRSSEIPFMMARPVPFRKVFLSQFADNLAYSSWSLAVLGVPLVVAWGGIYEVPLYQILAVILLGLWPLIVISAVIGAAILMGLVYIAYRFSPRVAVAVVLLIVAGSITIGVAKRQRNLIVEGAARSSTIERYISGLSREARKPILPSGWLTASMRALGRKDYKRAIHLTGLLTLTSLIWLRWIGAVAGRHYYKSWTAFGELVGKKSNRESPVYALKFNKGLLPNPLHAMLRKDILQFARSPSQWAQFMILVAFLLIYLLNLIYVSSRFNFEAPYWKTLVLFLNFAFTGFILATLSVRFVFPLISLEGKGFWVIRSAPVTTRLLFWEKFALAFVTFMGLCELIVYISNHVLHVRGAMMLLMTVAIFLMGATLTSLAIGMGAIFPEFKDESPMRIASTPGGVLTVVISMLYVGVMVAILAWPAKSYFLYLLGRAPFPTDKALLALAGVLALNALVMGIPIRAGYRAIVGRDI
jgi:ABC-2 type transport system permease protein